MPIFQAHSEDKSEWLGNLGQALRPFTSHSLSFLRWSLGFFTVSVARCNNTSLSSASFFEGPTYFRLRFLIQPIPLQSKDSHRDGFHFFVGETKSGKVS